MSYIGWKLVLSLVTRSDDNGPCCGPRHPLHRVREGVGPPVAGETLRLREAEVTQLISGRARTGLHGCLTPHTEFRSCGEFSADTSKSVPMIQESEPHAFRTHSCLPGCASQNGTVFSSICAVCGVAPSHRGHMYVVCRLLVLPRGD